MNSMNKIISAVFVLIIGSLLLISSGCNKSNGEGYAIYLTKEDVSPTKMEASSNVDIAADPIIGLNDIVRYNSQTYEMKLTDSAFQRISNLEVPVSGKSFVVTLDKKPIYWGAFWTPVSSIAFEGVTIWKPYGPTAIKIITLELGYPAPSFYAGKDPRNNPELLKSLAQSGKLINKLSIDNIEKLSQSMKGYELYSWMADNQWHFTLITGTNRNKTVEEIISADNFISEAGWIKIQVVGIDALKTVLSKVPKDAYITWLSGPRGADPEGVNFSLPPSVVIDQVKALAAQFGWILQ